MAEIRISICPSDSAGVPGSLIEQFGTDLTAPVAPGAIVTATSVLNPALLAGTRYWLVLTPFDNSTEIGWELGGIPPVPIASTASPSGIGGWTALGTSPLQLEVDGTIPEPASVLLLATALGLIAAVLRIAQRRSHPRPA